MGVVMLPHGTGSIKSCRKTYKREQAGRRAGNEASTAVPVNKMNSAGEFGRLRPCSMTTDNIVRAILSMV